MLEYWATNNRPIHLSVGVLGQALPQTMDLYTTVVEYWAKLYQGLYTSVLEYWATNNGPIHLSVGVLGQALPPIHLSVGVLGPVLPQTMDLYTSVLEYWAQCYPKQWTYTPQCYFLQEHLDMLLGSLLSISI